MFTRIKDFFLKIKDQIVLISSNLTGTIINAAFWMVLASILTKEEYGELSILFGIAFIGFAAGSLGIDKLIVVYGAKNEDVLQPAFALTLISAFVVSSIAFIFTNNIAISILIWGFLIFMPHIAEINSKKRYVEFSKQNLIYRVSWFVFSISLYYLLGLDGIILGAALASFPAFRWIYRFIKNKKVSITILRPKFNFMLSSYLSVLTITLFLWGDKLLIGPLYGLSILGTYTFAFQYAFLLNSIPVSLMIYLLPHEAQKNQKKKLKIYSVIISSFLTVFLIILAPVFVNNFFQNFQEAILPMQIMVVGMIPLVISTIFEASFFGREKSRIVFISTGIQTGSYFILLLILGAELGLVGFALSFLTSIIIRCIVNVIAYKFSTTNYE